MVLAFAGDSTMTRRWPADTSLQAGVGGSSADQGARRCQARGPATTLPDLTRYDGEAPAADAAGASRGSCCRALLDLEQGAQVAAVDEGHLCLVAGACAGRGLPV